MSLLTDTLARALCAASGADPAEIVHLPAPGGPLAVEAWVKSRPRALMVVAELRRMVGEPGVQFLESALRLVIALKAAGGA